MKRVYTQPEAELIVFDVNDVQMLTLKKSGHKNLTEDSFSSVGGFNWDSKANGIDANSFKLGN